MKPLLLFTGPPAEEEVVMEHMLVDMVHIH